MKRIMYSFLIVGLFAFSGIRPVDKPQAVEYSPACCKICKKGKACGDSCISREYQCHKPKGCACDG